MTKGNIMYDKLIKGIYKYGKKTIKRKIIEKASREANEDIDDFAKDWLDIGNANPANEDEYMKEYAQKKEKI